MNNLPGDLIDQIKLICKKYHVKTLELFGSMSRNDFTEQSDADFLYEFDKDKIGEMEYADNYFDFFFSMERILKRKVDLIPKLKLKNPYFIKSVSKDIVKIYG